MSFNTHSSEWKFVRNISLAVFGLALVKVAFYFIVTSSVPLTDTNSSQFSLVESAQSVNQVHAANESSAQVRGHGQENR